MKVESSSNKRADLLAKLRSAAANKPTPAYVNSTRLNVYASPNTRMRKNHQIFIEERKTTHLTTLVKPNNVIRTNLPWGSFNGSIVELGSNYLCVYRSTEFEISICTFNPDFTVQPNSIHPIVTNVHACDPRLIWHNNKLLTFFSSVSEGFYFEHIRYMNLTEGKETIRVSPPELKMRQKNWTPFIYNGDLYVVTSICPHVVYKLDLQKTEPYTLEGKSGKRISLVPPYESEWSSVWFHDQFLRGNTNPVQLEDGNYLSTFHTVVYDNTRRCYYNGCYVFEGKPPFKVLRCATRSFLKAEDACEPYFRRSGEVVVTFPMAMIRKGNDLLISYGDNDSIIKILKTTVAEMLDTTVPV